MIGCLGSKGRATTWFTLELPFLLILVFCEAFVFPDVLIVSSLEAIGISGGFRQLCKNELSSRICAIRRWLLR
ncbi:hypothetical protein Aasi_1837 [Candidatus Amoebophilus asiaticus 5a2]|uniref:Uncharacterized protein n=1 Tax=Amoebophilus asiaticus (strain 5a2) TaxID=452471 RepID=C3L441_AMOA5|nr:hypothetical protein Aasi_1837 [Candidatus Amoebophilus asiaticus 5a2]